MKSWFVLLIILVMHESRPSRVVSCRRTDRGADCATPVPNNGIAIQISGIPSSQSPRDAASLIVDVEDVLMTLAILERGNRVSNDMRMSFLKAATQRACRVFENAGSDCINELLVECLRETTGIFGRAFVDGSGFKHFDAKLDVGWLENAANNAQEEIFTTQLDASTLRKVEEWHPRGHCLFTTSFCPIRPWVSGLVIDEREHVYRELALLPDDKARKEACLQRAETNWKWCGHARDASVSMIWRPAGTALMNSHW